LFIGIGAPLCFGASAALGSSLQMIAQKTRYALRSLLFLAEEQGGAPGQLARIAETQRVPPKYLELIMLDLKKAGLVKSARGPKGGYRLSRPADQISFGEIVRTMEGPIALVSCASVNFYAPCGDCHDEATCAIRRAFSVLRDQSTAVLDSISLAEGAQWEERLGVEKQAD
jgi:Rrf2 family protein